MHVRTLSCLLKHSCIKFHNSFSLFLQNLHYWCLGHDLGFFHCLGFGLHRSALLINYPPKMYLNKMDNYNHYCAQVEIVRHFDLNHDLYSQPVRLLFYVNSCHIVSTVSPIDSSTLSCSRQSSSVLFLSHSDQDTQGIKNSRQSTLVHTICTHKTLYTSRAN